LKLPLSYYRNLRALYAKSRKLLLQTLEDASFTCTVPEGAYYVWTDIRRTGFKNDRKLAEHLIKKIGVGAVPGSSFYHLPTRGRLKLRFSFSKRPHTIEMAASRLGNFQRARSRS
jgi:L-glutamine---4-(methylsulfanyl)-2-oxobutanoate aminotransferase